MPFLNRLYTVSRTKLVLHTKVQVILINTSHLSILLIWIRKIAAKFAPLGGSSILSWLHCTTYPVHVELWLPVTYHTRIHISAFYEEYYLLIFASDKQLSQSLRIQVTRGDDSLSDYTHYNRGQLLTIYIHIYIKKYIYILTMCLKITIIPAKHPHYDGQVNILYAGKWGSSFGKENITAAV